MRMLCKVDARETLAFALIFHSFNLFLDEGLFSQRQSHFTVEAKLLFEWFPPLSCTKIPFRCSTFHPNKNASLCLFVRSESIMSLRGMEKVLQRKTHTSNIILSWEFKALNSFSFTLVCWDVRQIYSSMQHNFYPHINLFSGNSEGVVMSEIARACAMVGCENMKTKRMQICSMLTGIKSRSDKVFKIINYNLYWYSWTSISWLQGKQREIFKHDKNAEISEREIFHNST